jgi:shikimate kinase
MFIKSLPNLTLIGFPTSGKTYLGRLLAQRLSQPFIDIDELIQQYHSSLSCREIFQAFGEGYFRYLEKKTVLSLEQQGKPHIIATGGGTLLQESNAFSLKRHSFLIYLKIPAAILKERILNQSTLPSYLHPEDPENSFTTLYAERTSLYEKWADQIIEIDSSDYYQTLNELSLQDLQKKFKLSLA